MWDNNECIDEFGRSGFQNVNPGFQTLDACGYDRLCYISTAKLLSSPYVTQALIEAKIGGLLKLIEAVDDSVPAIGDLTGAALATYNSVIQNVVTEINGYLTSIYPIPLAQTGTVAIIKVSEVSTDGLGTVTAIEVIYAGNYKDNPTLDNDNLPAYLRYIDPLANERFWGCNWASCQRGSGLSLDVAYADSPFSDENGTTVQARVIDGTPDITDGGTDYTVGDLIVLTGGTSFVPAKVREASLILICHSLYQRRLAPDEKNPFSTLAKFWRDELVQIGHGEMELDGTYKRFFSIGAVWGQKSVLFGANSL